MPAAGAYQTLLSPAELAYIHSSLSLQPPIRPDLRAPTEFRPLVAETEIIPTTNGSARVCFSDGTEAIVGVKAEIEKAEHTAGLAVYRALNAGGDAQMQGGDGDDQRGDTNMSGDGRASGWLEVSVEIPGFRDDDTLPVFLSSMLTEVLLMSDTLKQKLSINERWHWKLHIDILLLSQPLSYPLPLLSLTTHLALLNTALPRLTSDPGDDPLFDDDWAAAVPLYDQTSVGAERPPVTLLVMTVGDNIIFDSSKEELAVAEGVVAVSVVPSTAPESDSASLKLLAIRMIDPPSRLTPLGVSQNPGTSGGRDTLAGTDKQSSAPWSPPKGGIKRALLSKILKMVLDPNGIGGEVLQALAAVET